MIAQQPRPGNPTTSGSGDKPPGPPPPSANPYGGPDKDWDEQHPLPPR